MSVSEIGPIERISMFTLTVVVSPGCLSNFFGITSFIKKKNNIFESYLFLVVDARFSRNSLANPASCTQLALFFLPLKTTINKKDLKLVPASKIMEMFLLSAAPPSLSWRRDRFPSKPLKLPFFLFFFNN